MKHICVIGWYGTETIGDRAILAGIVSLLRVYNEDIALSIGSLYPFFTRRSILEDIPFLQKCVAPEKIEVSIFNSMDAHKLKAEIRKSSLLIMGGGPLMDIPEMHMISFAFAYARSQKIKSFALGVGWGPLHTPEFINCAKGIVNNSTITIFRDETSLLNAESADCTTSSFSIDPALLACQIYKQNSHALPGNRIAVANYRHPTPEYGHFQAFDRLIKLTQLLCDKYDVVKLLPMHSFFIGGDDRELLNSIKFSTPRKNISVANTPPTLQETFEAISTADLCVGMRFHSIVLQSYLNGANLIIDYTDPKDGKIINFCRTFLTPTDLMTRRRNIYVDELNFDIENVKKIKFPKPEISTARLKYQKALMELA